MNKIILKVKTSQQQHEAESDYDTRRLFKCHHDGNLSSSSKFQK